MGIFTIMNSWNEMSKNIEHHKHKYDFFQLRQLMTFTNLMTVIWSTQKNNIHIIKMYFCAMDLEYLNTLHHLVVGSLTVILVIECIFKGVDAKNHFFCSFLLFKL